MTTDDVAQQLHDRATRGEGISEEETLQLNQWYATQDQQEGHALAQAGEPRSLVALRSQVGAAVAQLRTTTERIQTLTVENEAVRREIAALERRLAQQATT